MGFWASLGDKIKGAVEKVGDGLKAVGRAVKSIPSAIKKGATNLWNKFSGKGMYKEADELYEKIKERYNKRKQEFDESLKYYTDSIENHVKQINKAKETIKTDLFVRMATNMEKIHDISISKDFSIEEYKAEILSFDSIRSKETLYKIDFNKHKFKTTIQAIFTLGFYTRKKAKETLLAVKEEEKKIEVEISKMDAEINKLKVIDKSLENVEMYFMSLIALYEKLLVRLDNNVNYLYIRCISFAHKLVHEKMSIRVLPEMQKKEVEAIVTASIILKTMTDKHILSIENSDEVKKYSKEMKEQYNAINKVAEAA